MTRILDFKAPGLPGYSTTELAMEGNAMNPTYFDLGKAVDTVSCEIRIAKSTVTYVATTTTQDLNRLARKTLATSTSMMKKKATRNRI